MIFVFFSLLRKWIYVNVYLQMGGVILLFVLSYVMPNMQFMQISVAVHYSAYFGLGILYCIYKGRIDAILLRYKYGMFLGSFALSASLLPWKLVAALVGIRLHLYCVPAFLFPADACARTYCPCFSGGEPISVFVCLVCVGILVTHPLWRDIS